MTATACRAPRRIKSRWCQVCPPCNPLPMPATLVARRPAIVLMVLVAIVQCLAGNGVANAQDQGAPSKGDAQAVVRVPNSMLPVPVAEVRDAILAAVASGDIEELRLVLEWNELRPELGMGREQDAIKTWKTISRDGKGLEILAILAELLEGGPARMPLGRDFENNNVFVWPYISELETDKLTHAQEIELYRMVPPQVAQRIVKTGAWSWYRLGVGADGVWHIFSKGER